MFASPTVQNITSSVVHFFELTSFPKVVRPFLPSGIFLPLRDWFLGSDFVAQEVELFHVKVM